MEQMGLNEEQQQNVIEKFRKSILHEFSALKDCQYGVSGGNGSMVRYPPEPQDLMHPMSREHERKTSHATRNKLESKCKSYKCMFFTWQFQMEDFKVMMEDGQTVQAPTCNFWGVPHKDYQMKVQTNKPKKQQKARSGRGGNQK